MDTRSIALIAIFTALALVLNIVSIPTIYWPGFSYHFSEIPIAVAFILFGPKIGVLVAALNVVGLEIFFPVGPAGFVVYPMGFVAILIMFFGMYLASRFFSRKNESIKTLDKKKQVAYFTAFAAAIRGGIMPFLTYGVLYHVLLPLVLGTNIPEIYIATLVPSFVLYNVTLTLYTVPIAYIAATKIGGHMKIEPRLLIRACNSFIKNTS
jgi:riboflavin transporter FmnP